MSNKDINQQINWNVNQIAKKIRLLKAISKDGYLTAGDIGRIDGFIADEIEDLDNVAKKQLQGEFVEPEFNIQDK